eukprot:Skav235504  [mRNA]  locus=scaffold625:67753:72507:- [translate_table: standard]
MTLLPDPIWNLTRKFDVAQPPFATGARVNLILGNFQEPCSPDIVVGKLLATERPTAASLIGTTCFAQEAIVTDDPVHLHLCSTGLDQVRTAEQVYVHHIRVTSTNPLRLQEDPECLIIPKHPKCASEAGTRMIELFAGGVGGWAFAAKALFAVGLERRPIIAVEKHLPYATQYCLTHRATLVADMHDLPPNLASDSSDDMMFQTEVQDIRWQRQVQHLSHEVWTISSPCQSWSEAGPGQGFGSVHGQAFADAVALARIYQPKVLALEQVQGFPQHAHFPLVAKLMHWAGFRLVWAQVYDLATVVPTYRKRWLAIYVSKDVVTTAEAPQPWPHAPITPEQFDFRFPLSHHQIQEFEPTIAQASLYFSPQYMPKTKQDWTHVQILAMRIPTLDQPLPTIMCQYGNQHNLPAHRLRQKGLLGFFLREGPAFRFFAPHELIQLLCQVGAITLLKPSRLAWETVGNSISILHAAFCLGHAFVILDSLPNHFDVTQLLQTLIASRVTASGSHFMEDEFAWYVGPTEAVAANHQLLHFFIDQVQWNNASGDRQWTRGMMFHPKHGLIRVDESHRPQVIEASLPDPNTDMDDDEPSSSTSEVVDLTATLPMHPWYQVCLYLIPGEYGTVHVAADTTWNTLLATWSHKLYPMEFALTPGDLQLSLFEVATEPAFRLAPKHLSASANQTMPSPATMGSILAFRPPEPSTDLYLYEVAHDTTWPRVNQLRNICPRQVSDVFGCIDLLHPLPPFTEVSEDFPEILVHSHLQSSHHLLASVAVEIFVPEHTDILVCHCEGTPRAKDAFLDLWFSPSMQSWYDHEGRQCNYLDLGETTWRILFRPRNIRTTTPLSIFRPALAARLLQVALAASKQPEGIRCTIKQSTRVLHVGTHAPEFAIASLQNLLKHVKTFNPNFDLGVTSEGQLLDPATTLETLQHASRTVVLNIAGPSGPLRLRGGGGSTKAPTAKQDFLRYVENGVAQLFIEHSLDLPQVAVATTKFLDHHGLPKAQQLIQQEPGTSRNADFTKMCAAASVALPHKAERAALTAAKFKKIKTDAQNKQSKHIQVGQYQLQSGYFLNQDGTAANLLGTFAPTMSGVAMVDPEGAQQWLSATQPITADDLALYVVGDMKQSTALPTSEISAPAVDSQGRSVILTGKLVQLGAKPISTIAANASSTETLQVQVVAVTMWKADFSSDMWSRIINSPVKASKDLLALEGFGDIFAKVWGRAFRTKGVSVTPELAESVQFHAEAKQGPRLQALLKRSGFNGVFLIPKTPEGTLDPHWAVIWLTQSPQKIELASATISGSAGLIKGAKNYGLRIETSQFSSAWKRLKPDAELPDMRQCAYTYRLQPLPLGLDGAILKQWAAASNWDIKPLKSTGAKRWLVGSDVPPPNILLFNSQPILAQQVPPKGAKEAQSLVAGPRLPAKPKSSHPKEAFRTGDPYYDPWTSYAPASLKEASSADTRPDAATASVDTRSLSGPITDRFAQQDARLTELEKAMTKMEHTQQAQHQAQQAKMTHLENTFQAQTQQTQHTIDQLHQEQQSLNSSLSAAFSRQDARLASAMDELKSLFLSSRGKKRQDPSEPSDAALEESE